MFGRNLSGIGFVVSCAALASLAGCASVDVTRISDANRDTAKGFRYYMPRPYLVVKQPFTVAGQEYLALGTLNGDNSVEIAPASLPASVRDAMGHSGPGVIRIDRTRIAASDAVRASLAEPQSAADPAEKPAPKPAAPASSESETEASSDYGGTKGLLQTAGDPATDPRVDLHNPLFDIIYLPDFEEQYAVRVSGGLGKGSLQLGLENGWMVERASAEVDNTELGKFIYRNIDKATDLAIGAARVAMGLPPGLASSSGSAEEQAAGPARGVLLRIVVLTEAQPGTYPFLKLSETTKEFASNQRSGPAEASTYVHLACPPDTRVSYNAVRRVRIELVSLEPEAAERAGGGTDAELLPKVNGAIGAVPGLEGLAAHVVGAVVEGRTLVLLVKAADQDGLTSLDTVLAKPDERTKFLKSVQAQPGLAGIDKVSTRANEP